jgi:probable HAF family extracellular repeat protein
VLAGHRCAGALLLAGAFGLAACSDNPAAPALPDPPQLTILSTFGGNHARALGISSDGSVVVGWSLAPQSVDRAFRWTESGGLQDMGTLGGSFAWANGISPNGEVVVGLSSDDTNGRVAFRWMPGTGMVSLGTLGGAFGVGMAATSSGNVVVGQAENADGIIEAFRWTENGGMQGLGTLGTLEGSWSVAHGVSGDGSVVVGRSVAQTGYVRAFRWTAAQGMVDLPVPAHSLSGVAHGISADGSVIVGSASDAGDKYRPVIWRNGSMLELGTLFGDSEGVTAVSPDGTAAVGVSAKVGLTSRAFRWTEERGLENLNVVFSDIIPLGWELRFATAVSNGGTYIVGWAWGPQASHDRPFILYTGDRR